MAIQVRRSAPTFVRLAALAWMAVLLAGSVVLADIAVLKEGAGEWNDPANWTIDGQPATVIPGGPARAFWSIIIDEGDTEANVFLDAGPRQIHALTINGGDTLQIKGGANLILLTNALEQGGNVINNSGLLAITEQGQLVLQGNNTPNSDDDIVTLRGGGVIALDSQLRAGTTLGARIIGQGGQPRVLLNEDNTIRGHGEIGRGTLKIINRGEVVADDPNEVLTIDPGSGSPTVPGDYTNDGGTARATGGGVLRLIAGTFNNINGGRIVAENNSTVELAFGAHIHGGLLLSNGGRFVVTGDAFLNGINNGMLTVSTNIEVRDGHELVLQGDITNNSTSILQAETLPTQLTIDGDVSISGSGVIELATIMPGLNRASIGTSIPGSVLTLAGGQQIVGTGVIEGPFTIKNEGTISANQGGRTLRIMPTSGNTLENTGTLQAVGGTADQGGGVLNLLASWDLTGDGSGTIQALTNSFVLLNGVTVQGQTFKTPDNPTATDPLIPIDTTRGVIRANGVGSQLDVRDSLLKNEGLIEIPGSARLTLIGKPVGEGKSATDLPNSGTVFLNGDTNRPAELWVSGGDVRLTGGGRIVLSDSDRNRIDQSVTEQRTHTFINVDNLIAGGGNIGNNRLNVHNLKGGVIRNTVFSPLVIDPPEEGAIARNEGLIEATGFGSIQFLSGKYENTRGALIRAESGNQISIEDGQWNNQGTIESMGPAARLNVSQSVFENTGIIAATGGAVVDLSRTTIVNRQGANIGTLAAGDGSSIDLSGRTSIVSGQLVTSANGVIRVLDDGASGLSTDASFVAAPSITLSGNLEVTNGATATVLNAAGVFEGVFENKGLIMISANDAPTTLRSEGANLTGGGTIQLTDNELNHFLLAGINEDNTIRGSGNITGGAVLLGPNSKIIADGTKPLLITLEGGPAFVSSDPLNLGLIRAEGTGGIDSFALENRGTIVVTEESKFRSRTTLRNGRIRGSSKFGTIIVDGQFEGLIDNENGEVFGNGRINGALFNRRMFSPGESPGTLAIVGEFEQANSGTLMVELAGHDPGLEFDQVIVDGTATLGGAVVVLHLDGFAPEVGAEFDVVSAATFIDNGFQLAILDGGLARPGMVDVGDGTTALRLTSIEGDRYAPVSGSWDDASNWPSETLPGTDDVPWIVGAPASDTTVEGPGTDTNLFSLLVGSGEEAVKSTTTLILGAGTITTTRGTTLRQHARLTGSGTVGGDLYNAGMIAPGDQAGTIHITGNYNQNEIGTLTIELGGMAPDEQYDQLTVSGTAAVDGTLDVSLVDLGDGSYQPAGGEKFTILTAEEQVAGGFATANLPSLTGGLAWEIDYLPNTVELRTFLVGDYNNNGTVEQGDLDVVLLNWGVDAEFVGLPAEWINQRPSEGLIDQAELDLVLLNWGASIAPFGSASVPEPSTAWLILVGILAIGFLRRRATLKR